MFKDYFLTCLKKIQEYFEILFPDFFERLPWKLVEHVVSWNFCRFSMSNIWKFWFLILWKFSIVEILKFDSWSSDNFLSVRIWDFVSKYFSKTSTINILKLCFLMFWKFFHEWCFMCVLLIFLDMFYRNWRILLMDFLRKQHFNIYS